MKKTKFKQKHKKKKIRPQGKIPVLKENSFDGNLGAFSRYYPPREKRDEIIKIIKAIQTEKRSSDEWWRLGEYIILNAILDENDEFLNEGIQALQSGADHSNPSSACLMDLGWILMFKNMDSLALSPLEKAFKLNPNSRDIVSLLARCYLRNNNKEKGIEYLKVVLEINKNSQSESKILKAFDEGYNLDHIKKHYCELGKIDPSDPDFSEMSSKEQTQIFKQIIKQRLKIEPDNFELIKVLGTFEYLLNQFESSKQNLEKYILFNPNDAEILTTIALIYRKFLKDRVREEEFYRKALEVDENHILALTNLSSLLQSSEEYHKAKPFLGKALSICRESDQNYPILLDLFGSNIGVLDGNFKEEAHFHLQAFSINPKQVTFAINALVSLLSFGDYNRAIQFSNQNKNILNNDERSSLILHIIQGLKPNLKKPNHFLSMYDQMLELSTNNFEIKDLLFSYLKKSWFYRSYVKEELETKMTTEESNDLEKAYYNDIGLFATDHNQFDFALEIWNEAENKFTGDDKNDFILNKAVCLSHLDKVEDALDLIQSLDLKKIDRGFTILGNTQMNAYQYLESINSYKKALKYNPKFILPISNAIDCCQILKRPDLVDDFLFEINNNWKGNTKANFLKSEILLLQGKSLSSFKNYELYFYENGKVLDPTELHNKVVNPENDLTLLGKPSTKDHKNFAHSCILSNEIEKFYEIFNLIEKMPEWMDGDWLVLKSEALRRQNKLADAKKILLDMPEQPPNLASLSLCALEELDYKNAKIYCDKIINFEIDPTNYSHIEGKPNAIAKAIIALEHVRNGNLTKAFEISKQAIDIDISCAIARTTYANIFITNNDIDEAIKNLKQGLSHNLGSVPIIKLLIETLIDKNSLEDAADFLHKNRDIISENGYIGVGERLGEMIALNKLKIYENEIDLKETDLMWSDKLSDLSKTWLKAYLQIETNKMDLNEAKLFYLSKIIEKELGDKIFFPFKSYLKKPYDYINDRFQDFSKFLTGDYAPSLGGMHRIFRAYQKKHDENDPELIIKFRSFFGQRKLIFNKDFLQQLNSLSHLRNSLAHVGDPDTDRLKKTINLILGENKPGIILSLILKI